MKSRPIYQISPDGTISTDRLLLTIDETAQVLGMSAKSLRNKVAPSSPNPLDSKLKPIRVGRSIRFRLDDILKISTAGDTGPGGNGGANERDGAMSGMP